MILNTFFDKIKHSVKLRKMQYTSDQEGILRRYYREKKAWDNHLTTSKGFILKSAQAKNKNHLVVLGSGWLLDLPINELSSQFKKITLVDINHPKRIIHKTKQYNNIELVYADITGGLIDYFYKKNHTNFIDLETLKGFNYTVPKADFVISLNIMCQLHIILIDYLKTTTKLTSSQILEIEKIIQESHLNILPPNKTCLITDIEEEIYSDEDHLMGINPLIKINLPSGNFSKKWLWKFDSMMTYREDAKTYFNTIAIDF